MYSDRQIIAAILDHAIVWCHAPDRIATLCGTWGRFALEIEREVPNRLLLTHRTTGATRQILEAGEVWDHAIQWIADLFDEDLAGCLQIEDYLCE